MRISRLGGIISTADTTLYAADKVECLFEADAAIPVGSPVQHDLTSNTSAKLIVPSVTGEDHCAVGVYEGKGGNGAAVATTGLTGNAAVDGDIVYVTTYGVAAGLVTGGATLVVSGSVLDLDSTAGQFGVGAAIGAGLIAPFVSLEAVTTAAGTVCTLFVKAL